MCVSPCRCALEWAGECLTLVFQDPAWDAIHCSDLVFTESGGPSLTCPWRGVRGGGGEVALNTRHEESSPYSLR